MQVYIYIGILAGIEVFKAAEKVLIDIKKEGIEVKP